MLGVGHSERSCRMLNSVATFAPPVTGLLFSRLSQPGFQDHFSKIQLRYPYKSVTMGLAVEETKRTVWLWTRNRDVMTASVERGWDTFIFTPETQSLYEEWKSLAKIRSLFLKSGKVYDEESEEVALFTEVSSAQDLQSIQLLPKSTDIVVMDAKEWQIISSENMVASFQHSETSIFATARNAHEARIYFESLEKGTDGVVLQTEDPSEVLALTAYLTSNGNENIVLLHASVQRVEQMGMGDRVCVDLCSLLVPGEGLLVGSFARGLFLVHSECLKSDYVASRPFRVNAGPVHAYVAMPGGKTSYLAELESGMQILVVDAYGRQRSATIGRLKIERRPLVLVEAVAENDKNTTYSLLLQNAETVSLVCLPEGADTERVLAIPVTKLNPGDKVLLSKQGTARHTGMAIDEFIVEK